MKKQSLVFDILRERVAYLEGRILFETKDLTSSLSKAFVRFLRISRVDSKKNTQDPPRDVLLLRRRGRSK